MQSTPTSFERNDKVATGGIGNVGTGKVEILDHVKISVSGFRSYHPGLVVMAYADTHVARTSDTIDPRMLVALTTYAGMVAR